MFRSRFSQPDDYEPASIDKDEVVQQHFRNKALDDAYESEPEEERDNRDDDQWSSYE